MNFDLTHTVPTVRPVQCHYCSTQMQQGERYTTFHEAPSKEHILGRNLPACSACVTDAREAQFALNYQPSGSAYWDSHTGQDHLKMIQAIGLVPETTEEFRRKWFAETMRDAREDI